MKASPYERLLQQIRATQDEELSCSECFDLVSHYVDLELAGKDAAGRLPRLAQHLGQCLVCREEYEMLRDLARLEAAGRAPSIDELRKLL